MASLIHLRDLRPSVIYPGHGPVISDGTEKINEYIEHRMARERQVSSTHCSSYFFIQSLGFFHGHIYTHTHHTHTYTHAYTHHTHIPIHTPTHTTHIPTHTYTHTPHTYLHTHHTHTYTHMPTHMPDHRWALTQPWTRFNCNGHCPGDVQGVFCIVIHSVGGHP